MGFQVSRPSNLRSSTPSMSAGSIIRALTATRSLDALSTAS
jgi:hypothetical protein